MYSMTHCFCRHVGVSTSFNCIVPGIRLSYFSFPCCMTLSSSQSIYSISFALQSLCDDVATIYRVGCVVYNVHEQVMPESCHYLTALHALSHPCLVSLLFIPSLYSTFFNSKNFSFTCNSGALTIYARYASAYQKTSALTRTGTLSSCPIAHMRAYYVI